MKLMAEAVSVMRGDRMVVTHLSFGVEAGEALVLVGPNGAGKTTLIRCIAGLLRLSAGQIRLEGAQPERTLGEECHYVGHLNGVKASLTVEENATFWSRYLGGASEQIEPTLATFGLTTARDVPVGYVSFFDVMWRLRTWANYREADTIIARTRDDASRFRDELKVKAQAEAATIVKNAEQRIEMETARALQQIRAEAVEFSVAIASKILQRNVSKEDNERLIEETFRQIQSTRPS